MDFSIFREKLSKISYGLNVPTAILVVPGLSLLLLKIKVSHLFEEIKAKYKTPESIADLILCKELVQLDRIYYYHLIASTIQFITYSALSIIHPLFLLPVISSLYEIYCCGKGVNHEIHANFSEGKIRILR